MRTQSALLLELLTAALGAAAQSARDVRTRLKVVQKILMDVPQVVTVDDVKNRALGRCHPASGRSV